MDEDAEFSKHSHRTHSDIRLLVEGKCERHVEGSWDDREFRNAGEIRIHETETEIVIEVPLPYFHKSGQDPADIQASVKRHFPPSCRVRVDVLPPPSRRG